MAKFGQTENILNAAYTKVKSVEGAMAKQKKETGEAQRQQLTATRQLTNWRIGMMTIRALPGLHLATNAICAKSLD